MARKKVIRDEAAKIQEQLDLLKLKEQDLLAELEELEQARIADLEAIKIQVEEKYFAGVVLELEDIFVLLRMLQTQPTVKIPFNLYLKED